VPRLLSARCLALATSAALQPRVVHAKVLVVLLEQPDRSQLDAHVAHSHLAGVAIRRANHLHHELGAQRAHLHYEHAQDKGEEQHVHVGGRELEDLEVVLVSKAAG